MFTRQQNLTGDIRIPFELGVTGLTAGSGISIRYVQCTKDGAALGDPVSVTISNAPSSLTGSWSPGNFGPLYSGSGNYQFSVPFASLTSPRTLWLIKLPDGTERIGEMANFNYAVLASGSLTQEYVSGTWNAQRQFPATGSFGFYLDAPNSTSTGSFPTTASISNAVWAAATRTLTSGTVDAVAVATQVWLNAVRTLSSGTVDAATIATQVWGSNARTLTSGTIDVPSIVSGVWNAATRSLTTSSLDSAAVGLAVWSAQNRTATASVSGNVVVDPTSIAAGVWNTVRGNAISGTFGSFLDSVVSTATSSMTTASIALGVWNASTRSLTTSSLDPAVIAASVWANASRTLTSGTVDATTIGTAVWNNATRTLTSGTVDAATISTAVWAAVNRSLTSGSVDVASISNAVWNAVSRTLTGITVVDSGSIASTVWNANRSLYGASGTFGEGVSSVRGNVFGNVTGSVGVVNSIGSGGITNTSLASNATQKIADDLLDAANAIETNITLRSAIKVIAAALAGTTIGAGGASIVFKNVGTDTITRITAAVNPLTGERTSVTLNIP